MSKPWDAKWKIIESLPGGGQCNNYIVASKDKGTSGYYVLKALKNEKMLERRKRFYREVHNTVALNDPHFPTIVDHNCNESPDAERKLYFVYPYIDGMALEEFITANGGISLPDGVHLVMRLAEVLQTCHRQDIIHRDIKPDNIILRENELTDPILIDFGLSAGPDDEPMDESAKDQLGNRFLYLPELKYSGGDKRDKRSDITYLAGILFYVLTGEYPAHFLDEKGRLPHQRFNLKELVPNANSNQYAILLRIFDSGFQTQLNGRFQSIDHLVDYLKNIIMAGEKDDFNYNEFLKTSASNALIKLVESLSHMLPQFKSFFREISTSITEKYKNIQVAISGPSVLPHWDPMCIAGHFYLTEKFQRKIKASYETKIFPNGNEYVLRVKAADEEHIIERFQSTEELNLDTLKEEVEKVMVRHFALLMKNT